MPERVVLPIHGADHCPGGPDPIPCLESSPYPVFRAAQNDEETEVPSGDDGILLFDFWINGDDSVFSETTTTGPVSGDPCVSMLQLLQPGLYSISCAITWNETPGSGFTQDRGVGFSDGFMDEDWFTQAVMPTSNVMMTSFSIVRAYPGVGEDIGFEAPLSGRYADLVFRGVHLSGSSKHTVYPTHMEVVYLGPVDATA